MDILDIGEFESQSGLGHGVWLRERHQDTAWQRFSRSAGLCFEYMHSSKHDWWNRSPTGLVVWKKLFGSNLEVVYRWWYDTIIYRLDNVWDNWTNCWVICGIRMKTNEHVSSREKFFHEWIMMEQQFTLIKSRLCSNGPCRVYNEVTVELFYMLC